MVKTITISDKVYEKLAEIKGNRSFSQVIMDLLKKEEGNFHILLIAFGCRKEKEAKDLEKTVKRAREVMNKWLSSLTQTS